MKENGGMKEEPNLPHSPVLICYCPASSPFRVLRHQREEHREEGDPGDRHENIPRRAEVTHRGPPGVRGFDCSLAALR
jgi:hypothetical protein